VSSIRSSTARRSLVPDGSRPAGTEVVEFSPTEEYRRTFGVIAQNFAALQAS
jgi:hypothetical protein